MWRSALYSGCLAQHYSVSVFFSEFVGCLVQFVQGGKGNQMLQVIDNCDYYFYNEDCFQEVVHSCDGMNLLILHQNIRSIVNKHDDLVIFFASLNYELIVSSRQNRNRGVFSTDDFSAP